MGKCCHYSPPVCMQVARTFNSNTDNFKLSILGSFAKWTDEVEGKARRVSFGFSLIFWNFKFQGLPFPGVRWGQWSLGNSTYFSFTYDEASARCLVTAVRLVRMSLHQEKQAGGSQTHPKQSCFWRGRWESSLKRPAHCFLSLGITLSFNCHFQHFFWKGQSWDPAD